MEREGKAKILLLENEEDDIKNADDYLKRIGYEVFIAETYSRAKQLCENIDFDLAIIDVYLSKDSNDQEGIQFVKEELNNHDFPIIIWTGKPDYKLVKSALKNNEGKTLADDFVSKSDGVAVLSDSVKSLLKKNKTRRSKAIFGYIILSFLALLASFYLWWKGENPVKIILLPILLGLIANIITFFFIKNRR